MNNNIGPHDLETARYIVAPNGDGIVKAVTDMFYPELDSDFDGFKGHNLVQKHCFTEAWPGWEMHPHGDEMVLLLSGDIDFVLWQQDQETVVRISEPGNYLVVPRGTWHTARPHAPTELLFVTPGEGTRNAASPTA